MGRFTKKPVTIEAVQFTGSNHDQMEGFTTPTNWFPGPDFNGQMAADGKRVTAQVYDEIHDTWVAVRDGDWIIKGLKGEFYPCDPQVFADSYDKKED